MKLSREQLIRKYPRASESFLRANSAGGAASSAELEQAVCDEPMATPKREAQYTMRVRVSITAFRVRLLDPDNLCPKYFVDCLRYANCIRDDRSQDIALEIRQEKVASNADERTEIFITPL